MRTIKFRGKRELDGVWEYGSLIQLYNDRNKYIIEGESSCFVNPETIGQFTGLCDVNGKEIYEGDIIDFGSSDLIGLEVYWSEQRLTYCVRTNLLKEDGSTLTEMADLYYGYKVIGNIHDNPELIK